MGKRVVIYRRRSSKINLIKGFFFLSLALFICSAFLFIYRQRSSFRDWIKKPLVYKIYITDDLRSEFQPKIDQYRKLHPEIKIEYSQNDPKIIIDFYPKDHYQNFLIKKIPSLILSATGQKRLLRPEKNYWFISQKIDKNILDLENYLKSFYRQDSVITLNAVGDIIPGRTVALKMAQKGTNYPFSPIAPYTKEADIVYGDLECPLSDRIPPPYEGMSFIAPSSTISGLKLCGINVVSLANNHSTNFGSEVFLDTFSLLKENKIKYFGGGRNEQEAFEPLFFKVKGLKIAFLNYNSIIGGIKAEDTTPGVAWIKLKPWAEEDDKNDIERMKKVVQKAKEKSDIVIVCFHWGVEYQTKPIESQINVAHAAIESGASLVIGTHPHVVQAIEYWQSPKDKTKNGFIAYSLGNFVFDQMWSEETREGVILKCKFFNKDLSEVELLPYKIEDYCQPNLLDQNAGRHIIERIFSASNL